MWFRIAYKLIISAITVNDILVVFAAISLAALGGVRFYNSMLEIANWLQLPAVLIATTFAAFASSGPELVVSILAAMEGRPQIGLGDALGSNIVNVSLILGLALIFRPIKTRLSEYRRDFMFSLVVPVLTFLMTLDGVLSRLDGAFLIFLFLIWIMLLIQFSHATPERKSNVTMLSLDKVRALSNLIIGIVLLSLAGQLFIFGASNMATSLNLPPYIIGTTIVAIGTSMPELTTVLLSRLNGHDEIGLGTLLGSNLFNGLAIVGAAALIHPVNIAQSEVAITLLSGSATVLLLIPRKDGLSKLRGAMLLAIYALFVCLSIL